jgi:hypothetical protein
MTKVLEGIAIVALVLMFAMLAVHWGELPERYPMHFNVQGDPDGWGGKNSLLFLPCVAAGVFALLTFVSRKTKRFNLPFAVDMERPEVRAELVQLVAALKALVLVTLAYLYGRSMAVATGQARGLGMEFLPFAMAAVWPVLGYYFWRLRRYRIS